MPLFIHDYVSNSFVAYWYNYILPSTFTMVFVAVVPTIILQITEVGTFYTFAVGTCKFSAQTNDSYKTIVNKMKWKDKWNKPITKYY